jgi:parallel beta-helix repeat protein
MPASSVIAWAIGDEIIIGQTSVGNIDETERRIISTISGGDPVTIQWNIAQGSLNYDHSASSGVVVANLTRNVLVRSLGTTLQGSSRNSAYIENLSKSANGFVASYGEFSYLGSELSDEWSGISIFGTGTLGTLSNCSIHDGIAGIYVSGSGTFTNNVSYKNSIGAQLQNSVSTVWTGNQFISNSTQGLYIRSGSGHSITSNRFFSNAESVYSDSSPSNTYRSNQFYSNLGFAGLYLYRGSDFTIVDGNLFRGNKERGLSITGNSINYPNDITVSSNIFSLNVDAISMEYGLRNTFTGNIISSNTGYGILLGPSSIFSTSLAGSCVITQNQISSSTLDGIYLNGASNNYISSNSVTNNHRYGLYVLGSSSNTIISNDFAGSVTGINVGANLGVVPSGNTIASNRIFANTGSGMVLFFGGVLMVDNQIYSNGQYGMYLLGLNDSTMLGNAIYGNTSHGILGASVLRNVFADGFLGYDLQGQPARNLGAEVMMNGTSSSPSSLTLKQVRVHPTVGISTTGFDANGISLLSYNQDDDTGTLKVYGSHTVSSTTLTLDFLSPIYPSTVTVAKLMLGAGHSITGIVTSNTNTRSELVTVTYIGSNTWSVVGTRSGVVGTVTCGASSTCSFSDTKFQFTLRTGATITVSDRLEFATIAATAEGEGEEME